MTSSATQTERPPRGRLPQWATEHADLVVGAALAVAGWLVVLIMNRWWVGPPVVFLCIGWAAILIAGRALWRSASSAASETDIVAEAMPGGGFEVTATRRQDLEREKRALLKAIKEVEFDREMGKMSEQDASEIVRVYRGRAIEILKELDEEDAAAPPVVPVDQLIERELRARLALAGIKAKKKGGAA